MSQETATARIGYQKTYDEMLQRIETGKLDSYDLTFVEESYSCYFISPEQKPYLVRSKVYVYNSVSEAAIGINNATDTYEGQIVSVKYNDKYRAYIVNKNSIGFYITPLDQHPEPIDYNTLGNRPIDNQTGTLDAPIIISMLKDGIYAIDGQYQLTPTTATTYLTTMKHLFIVEHKGTEVLISKMVGDGVSKYVIASDDSITTISYITSDDLKSYATIEYVDNKFLALNYITEEQAKEFIQQAISESLDTTIDQKIDEQLNAKLAESVASSSEIRGIFA